MQFLAAFAIMRVIKISERAMKKLFSLAYREKDGAMAASRLACLYAAGYTGVSLAPGEGSVSPALLASVRGAGLTAECLYMPSDCVNLLWQESPTLPLADDALPTDGVARDDSAWQTLFALYSSFFAFAHSIGIDRVVVLPAVGELQPTVTQVGVDRFRLLSDEAERQGVRLLFENDRSAPHFEAVVRACCTGYHGVCFSPTKAWRYFGSSMLPPYAARSLARVRMDDQRGGVFGYLPFEGETDLLPFARSLAAIDFEGYFAISPDAALTPYADVDEFAIASRGYDRLFELLRLVDREAGGR